MRHGLVSSFVMMVMLVLPRLAMAHAGHDHGDGGLAAGFAHPLTGLDHLIAMLAIGLWASQLGGPSVVMLPVTFVSVMLVGAVASMYGLNLPLVEPVIVASLLVVGLLVACAAKLPMSAGIVITAAFAFFHGAAHGQETGEASPLLFAIGALLATILLHIIGVMLGSMLKAKASELAVRIIGSTVAAAGLLMMIGVL